MVVARKACFKVSWKHFAKTSLQCGQTPRFLFQRSIRYEQEFTDTVLDFIKLLNQGDVVFEIGSNIGQYSLLIASKIGSAGKLICLEPDSDNFALQCVEKQIAECNSANRCECGDGKNGDV